MFWEIPNDPRGALRWSLSKARRLVGGALQANRESVTLRDDAVFIDYQAAKACLRADLDRMPVAELERIATLFRGRFLDDLSLPRCPEFEAWRISHMHELEALQVRVRRALIQRLDGQPSRALEHARALLELSPEDKAVATQAESLAERSRRQPFAHAEAASEAAAGHSPPPLRAVSTSATPSPQDIHYCTTRDCVRIAYAISGDGPPIVKTANWMQHLHYDWESPIWRHWLGGLSQRNRLIRYDQRGNGLSDWDTADFSFEAMLSDLESVVDAAGIDRFALLGISQGCAVSVAYALRYPQRVSHLILYGGYVQGWRVRGDFDEVARRTAMGLLVRRGWGQNNPAFRQMFTSLFIPGASQEQMDWFNELQRKTISPKNAAMLHDTLGDVDVSHMLAQVTTPTLVLHAREDAAVPFGAGRAFATGIPGARFVPLESANHILLEHEPAFAQLLDEIQRFVRLDAGQVDYQPRRLMAGARARRA
jgi:pimeloyl-ACP methyl ester carboxylesterase